MTRYLLATMLLAAPLFAEGPEFEVASIKPFETPTPATAGTFRMAPAGGGPGTADPTHIRVNAMSPGSLLTIAFDVMPYQVINAGPANDMFNYEVVVPEGATKDDVKLMWQNLLASRFGLKYHIEQREFQVDELTVGPRGHKLVENNEPEQPVAQPDALIGPQPAPFTMDKDGRPVMPRPGMITMMTASGGGVTAKSVARAQPISVLVKMLANQMGHPVVDKTGLTAKYDFFMEFSPVAARAATASTPAADLGVDLSVAVQQQLGLRLAKGKGMLDVVVVDHLERKPTEN